LEFLFVELHYPFRYMMSAENSLKLILVDAIGFFMGFYICIPPISCGTYEPMDADDWHKTVEKKLQIVQSELGTGGMLERPGEGEEERERGGMVSGSSDSFYRGRGGHWRGGRREEGVPSMAVGTGADGVSGKGNDETDVSKGGERNW
jgi:hypothetical protein